MFHVKHIERTFCTYCTNLINEFCIVVYCVFDVEMVEWYHKEQEINHERKGKGYEYGYSLIEKIDCQLW